MRTKVMPLDVNSTNPPINWETVFDVEFDNIYNYLNYRLGDTAVAQDVTAETFEIAWKQRGRYDAAKGTAQAWLFGIARKRASIYFKRYARRREVLITNTISAPIDSMGDQFDNKLFKTALRSAIATLSERDQEIVSLKYGAGLTNRQIAKQLGLSESNIGTIIHRAVTYLRQRVGGAA